MHNIIQAVTEAETDDPGTYAAVLVTYPVVTGWQQGGSGIPEDFPEGSLYIFPFFLILSFLCASLYI